MTWVRPIKYGVNKTCICIAVPLYVLCNNLQHYLQNVLRCSDRCQLTGQARHGAHYCGILLLQGIVREVLDNVVHCNTELLTSAEMCLLACLKVSHLDAR